MLKTRYRTSIALITTALLGSGCAAKPKGSPADIGGAKYAHLETAPSTPAAESRSRRANHTIKTVFVIVMENHDWSGIKSGRSAPYLKSLFASGARSESYFSPRDIHPSEPNYIWMEAGDNLAITDDDPPGLNHRTTKAHLVTQLDTAGVPWRSYQEGISGTECPLNGRGRYQPKHNPVIFFDDQTDHGDLRSARCIEHVRPYEELERDLADDKVTGYNFITPDMCHDMHDSEGCETPDAVRNGDLWLSRELPKIFASTAYKEGGALFIVWDENEGNPSESIGMVVLSPFAKKSYENHIRYTHSSLLRTVQDIFAIGPYLRDAEEAADLSDLFVSYP
jgi:phosphatidylinositol-3-phosphatase